VTLNRISCVINHRKGGHRDNPGSVISFPGSRR
jgi:hypothetical protein